MNKEEVKFSRLASYAIQEARLKHKEYELEIMNSNTFEEVSKECKDFIYECYYKYRRKL